MGRLRAETLEHAEVFADRVVAVAESLERQRRSKRIVEQVCGSGTSVGANLFEADQAVTPKDFAKTLGVVVKELNETRFWLRFTSRRGWITSAQLAPLLIETDELLAIFNAMISRTRAKLPRKRSKLA